ncbi:hypothetical protein F4778DRAFT_153948 [Xylariomycetidae sp. FL2044]|nr:hypothetical protein F4778DRAFT_153948 [Xylariomycetidae sp. FL2044]
MVFLSLPRTKTKLHRTTTFDTMSTSSISTNASRSTSRNHDTGFPDSFDSHTTSMRHPDAVVDPGFAISAEDIDVSKTANRSRRRSILAKRNRRTISHGKITPSQDQGHPSRSMSGLSSSDSALDMNELGLQDAHESHAQMSKDGADSIHHTAVESINGDNVHSAASVNDEERRRSKFFGKWRSPKD